MFLEAILEAARLLWVFSASQAVLLWNFPIFFFIFLCYEHSRNFENAGYFEVHNTAPKDTDINLMFSTLDATAVPTQVFQIEGVDYPTLIFL